MKLLQLNLFFLILLFHFEGNAQNPCQSPLVTPGTAEAYFEKYNGQTIAFSVGESYSGCFTSFLGAQNQLRELRISNVLQEGEAAVGSVLRFTSPTTTTSTAILTATNGATNRVTLSGTEPYALQTAFTGLGTFTLRYIRYANSTINSNIVKDFTITFNVVTAAPVTWTRDLTYQSAGEQIEFNWSVAEQVDVAGYELEKMIPGGSFEKLSDIAYRENGALEVDYSVRTTRPTVGSYYRIKQLDYAGTFDYSNVLFVPGHDAAVEEFDVFPNPVSDFARMSVPATVTSVELISLAGRIVRSVPAAEVRREGVDVRDLAPGVYLVRPVSGSERSVTRRIVVNH